MKALCSSDNHKGTRGHLVRKEKLLKNKQMTKNKNNGKAILAGLAMFANAIPASAQERLEIQVTETNGVSRTIEVDRDIEELDFAGSGLTSITLPEGLTSLKDLNLSSNQLTNFALPNGLTNLRELWLFENQLTSLALPEGLTNLEDLRLSGNQLTNFTLPEELTNLKYLLIDGNQLTRLTLPDGLTNLKDLNLSTNQLTSLTLSPDTASHHFWLNLWIEGNPWMRIRWPVGLNISVRFDVGPEHYSISYYDILISRVENGLEIFWDVGVLQTSANIEGPWKDVIASSPLRVNPSLSSEFFRVRSKEQ